MARLQVLSVDEIELKILKKELTVSVSGSVVGDSWSDFKLSPLGEGLSKDGMIGLSFTGDNSGRLNMEEDIEGVLKEARAEFVVKVVPDDLSGVRVYTRENILEKNVEKSEVVTLIAVFALLLMFYLSLRN
jgi:hypothetical protein